MEPPIAPSTGLRNCRVTFRAVSWKLSSPSLAHTLSFIFPDGLGPGANPLNGTKEPTFSGSIPGDSWMTTTSLWTESRPTMDLPRPIPDLYSSRNCFISLPPPTPLITFLFTSPSSSPLLPTAPSSSSSPSSSSCPPPTPPTFSAMAPIPPSGPA